MEAFNRSLAAKLVRRITKSKDGPISSSVMFGIWQWCVYGYQYNGQHSSRANQPYNEDTWTERSYAIPSPKTQRQDLFPTLPTSTEGRGGDGGEFMFRVPYLLDHWPHVLRRGSGGGGGQVHQDITCMDWHAHTSELRKINKVHFLVLTRTLTLRALEAISGHIPVTSYLILGYRWWTRFVGHLVIDGALNRSLVHHLVKHDGGQFFPFKRLGNAAPP